MDEDIVLYEVVDSVARLTLNRPKAMNSMNLAVLAELDLRLTEIAIDKDVRVLVLTGAGAAFCAGADLKEVLAGQKLGPGETSAFKIKFVDHVIVPRVSVGKYASCCFHAKANFIAWKDITSPAVDLAALL